MKSQGDLLGYWKVLKKYRYLSWIVVLCFFFGSVIISLILPPAFESSVIIMPPKQESGSFLSKDFLPFDLGSLGKGKFGGPSSDLWIGILKSQPLNDAIITRFKIKEVYNQPTLEDARDLLSEKVKINKSKKDDLITVTVENKDPKIAAAMANAYVEELDNMNKKSLMTSGKRMRIFVENRLKEAKEQLVIMEEALRSFQKNSGAIKLDDQSKTIMDAAGEIKKQLMMKEVELETLLSYATPQNPQVEILNAEIKGLKNKMSELETGKEIPNNLFIPTSRISDVAVDYGRLLRDTKIQENLVQFLIQQYETAKIQEAKDTPTVEVLEWANVPERKSKPHKRKIVLGATFIGTIFALGLPFILEFLKNLGCLRSSESS